MNERYPDRVQLSEAIGAATAMADITIDALKGRIQAIRELEAARRDNLTGLWQRGYWEKLVRPRIDEIQTFGPESPEGSPNGALLVFADAEDLHFINNELGHVIGDKAVFTSGEAMKAFSDFMRNSSRTRERRSDPNRLSGGTREHDLLCRLGGDEFAGLFLIHVGADNNIDDIAELITARLERGTVSSPYEMPLISWGHTFILPGESKTLEEYIYEADPKLHMTDEQKAQREARKQERLRTGSY